MVRVRILMLLAALGAASGAAVAGPVVDLDAPGALGSLQASRPDRYRAVVAILDSAARLPKGEAEGVIRARYAVDDLAIGDLLMVSYPAKRAVSFRLDGDAYRALVTLRGTEPSLVPVAQPAR